MQLKSQIQQFRVSKHNGYVSRDSYSYLYFFKDMYIFSQIYLNWWYFMKVLIHYVKWVFRIHSSLLSLNSLCKMGFYDTLLPSPCTLFCKYQQHPNSQHSWPPYSSRSTCCIVFLRCWGPWWHQQLAINQLMNTSPAEPLSRTRFSCTPFSSDNCLPSY